MGRLLLILAIAGGASAGEYVLFDSGSRMRVDSHEIAGDKVRLHLNGGHVEVPAAMVAGFEVEEYAPPAPARPASAPEPDARKLIDAAAGKHGLPPEFVHSVVKAESGYRPDAVSPKGAVGLMQLMPSTARELNANPYDPAQNVEAGTAYLAELLRQYGGASDLALAAYNAGPGAVDRFKGVPPYRETRNYVERVLREYTRKSK
jgi:soluble lytic murein transglycosylase-like protein